MWKWSYRSEIWQFFCGRVVEISEQSNNSEPIRNFLRLRYFVRSCSVCSYIHMHIYIQHIYIHVRQGLTLIFPSSWQFGQPYATIYLTFEVCYLTKGWDFCFNCLNLNKLEFDSLISRTITAAKLGCPTAEFASVWDPEFIVIVLWHREAILDWRDHETRVRTRTSQAPTRQKRECHGWQTDWETEDQGQMVIDMKIMGVKSWKCAAELKQTVTHGNIPLLNVKQLQGSTCLNSWYSVIQFITMKACCMLTSHEAFPNCDMNICLSSVSIWFIVCTIMFCRLYNLPLLINRRL